MVCPRRFRHSGSPDPERVARFPTIFVVRDRQIPNGSIMFPERSRSGDLDLRMGGAYPARVNGSPAPFLSFGIVQSRTGCAIPHHFCSSGSPDPERIDGSPVSERVNPERSRSGDLDLRMEGRFGLARSRMSPFCSSGSPDPESQKKEKSADNIKLPALPPLRSISPNTRETNHVTSTHPR